MKRPKKVKIEWENVNGKKYQITNVPVFIVDYIVEALVQYAYAYEIKIALYGIKVDSIVYKDYFKKFGGTVIDSIRNYQY